jgi:hypothetical protein
LFWKRLLLKNRLSAIDKSSNNPLAVEPETENDTGWIFSTSTFDFNSVEAATPSAAKGIKK